MNLKQKWSEFVNKMNEKGIPIPLLRSPDTGRGSVSLTMMFISFNLYIIATVGKWSGYFGNVNSPDAFNLLVLTTSLYFGRSFNRSSNGAISMDSQGKPADTINQKTETVVNNKIDIKQ